jgi:hypothetical protein
MPFRLPILNADYEAKVQHIMKTSSESMPVLMRRLIDIEYNKITNKELQIDYNEFVFALKRMDKIVSQIDESNQRILNRHSEDMKSVSRIVDASINRVSIKNEEVMQKFLLKYEEIERKMNLIFAQSNRIITATYIIINKVVFMCFSIIKMVMKINPLSKEENTAIAREAKSAAEFSLKESIPVIESDNEDELFSYIK